MTVSKRRPRLAIIAASAVIDRNLSSTDCRVLLFLSIATDREGWGPLRQAEAADALDCDRRTIIRSVATLVRHGYLNKQEVYDEHSGARVENLYQVKLDRPLSPSPVSGLSQGHVTSMSDAHVSRESGGPLTQMSHLSLDDLSTPLPPQAGDKMFAELLATWPRERARNHRNAERAWERLSESDRAAVVRAAPVALSAWRRRNTRANSLVAFLRGQAFREFDGAPALDLTGEFVIDVTRPEFDVWIADIEKKLGPRAAERARQSGKLLRLRRWPEASTEGAAA